MLKTFSIQTYILAKDKAIDFMSKNKSLFSFNDTGLDTQRLDQKINYNYITRFKLISEATLLFYKKMTMPSFFKLFTFEMLRAVCENT